MKLHAGDIPNFVHGMHHGDGPYSLPTYVPNNFLIGGIKALKKCAIQTKTKNDTSISMKPLLNGMDYWLVGENLHLRDSKSCHD